MKQHNKKANGDQCSLNPHNNIGKPIIAGGIHVDFKKATIASSNVPKGNTSNVSYGVKTEIQTLPLLNMSCMSCAIRAEKHLKNTSGVVDATVNFAGATVKLEYIPDVTSVNKIRVSLQQVGFDLGDDSQESGEDVVDDIQQQKIHTLRRKTIIAILLSLPIVVIGMFFMNMPYANLIMWALSTPVILWIGRDFFINAWKQAKHRSANMDTLVALSTGVAYSYSIFNMIFPSFWTEQGLEAHVYFEAASVVVAFILLGKLLEEKAKGNTSSAIRKLMGLQPKTVLLIGKNGEQTVVKTDVIAVGNHIMVRPGERIPVDGTVIDGSSYVDESLMSGEPVPVLKEKGEAVFAGTINQKGSFVFKAEKIGSQTMLAHIIRLVKDAQGSKAPVQKMVDKVAAIFVPVVIILALLAFTSWIIFGGNDGFTHGLMALVTVLVIACPCALGLATPTAIMVGIGIGAERGILIKDAESLELAQKITAVVLDKTGTITEGKPQVVDAAWLHNDDSHKGILYSMERQSEHPLAEAVTAYLTATAPNTITDFRSITGKGITAQNSNNRYYVGNSALLSEKDVTIPSTLNALAEQWTTEAKTVIWFSNDSTALAVLSIADKIKESSTKAVEMMQKSGIEVYMLTGDSHSTAKAVAQKAGISHFEAEVQPKQKADFVKQLQKQGHVVAMVGDGINDSAALSQSDVSIAMGKGSDIAMDVAKITLISSDLTKIPQAIKLSKQTVMAIRQNLFWAFIYNIIGIPLAAGVLYPITGTLLNPMIAGAAMALSSVSVVSNSLRLKLKNR